MAGAFSGAAKFGTAMGATGAWVNKAASVGKMMGTAGAAQSMISQKNFIGAATLIANQFGAYSKAASLLNTVAKVENVHQAVNNDNFMGIVSGGTSLLQDFTGLDTDAFLSTLNKHTNTIQQVDTAAKTGNYGLDLELINDNFSSTLGISEGAQNTLKRIESGITYGQTVDNLIDNKDFAGAANMLLNATASHITNPETQQKILNLGNTLTSDDQTVKAFNEGRYSDALGLASATLGQPLPEKTNTFVENLQAKANTLENLNDAIKNNDFTLASSLVGDLTGSDNKYIDLIQKAGSTVDDLRDIQRAINSGDTNSALSLVNKLSNNVVGKGLSETTLTQVQNLATAIQSGDVSQSVKALDALTNGKHANIADLIG